MPNIFITLFILQTEVVQKSLNPQWNKYGEFIVDNVDHDELVVKVWDKDLTSDDDPLGSAEIPVSSLVQKSGNKDGAWWPLKNVKRGNICLRSRWFVPSETQEDFKASKEQWNKLCI